MKEEHFVGQVPCKAILKYNNKFIIVKEKNQEEWILPGGRLNLGESLEEGLLREIQEELGVTGEIGQIILAKAYHGDEKNKTPKLFVFYTVFVSDSQKILINNEISEYKLISKKADLDNYLMFGNQKDVLLKFLL